MTALVVRVGLRAVNALAVGLLLIPLCTSLLVSLSPSEYVALPTDGISLRWYREFFGDPRWTIALANSLDQAGPVTRTVLDAALLHEVIGGHDPLGPGAPTPLRALFVTVTTITHLRFACRTGKGAEIDRPKRLAQRNHNTQIEIGKGSQRQNNAEFRFVNGGVLPRWTLLENRLSIAQGRNQRRAKTFSVARPRFSHCGHSVSTSAR